ncbi:MAG: hypothetical protein KGJ13_12355, partial [Patescibacteria group bacterium]|nr:hypothetical protein [Patescibacteria group bacterium]
DLWGCVSHGSIIQTIVRVSNEKQHKITRFPKIAENCGKTRGFFQPARIDFAIFSTASRCSARMRRNAASI